MIPLPPLSSGTPVALRTGARGFRRFGVTEGDLSVDFSVQNRVGLTTHLLEVCTIDPNGLLPEGIYNELSIGKRIECLLLLALGGLDKVLNLTLTCQGCGQDLGLELGFEEISEIQRKADQVEFMTVDLQGRRIEFRKPKGRDQMGWAEQAFRDERDAMANMIGGLAMPADFSMALTTAEVNEIEEAFDEADPLVNFSCRVSCGECGKLNEHRVDLMEAALGMLQQAQNKLINTVHSFALQYHWSEADIFAVPEWRRQKYVQLIEAGKK